MSAFRSLNTGDAAEVEAFLRPHAATSMFLRSNLRESGLAPGSVPFHGDWVGAEAEGALVGVVGHFWNGTLILQAPRDPVGLAAMALETSGRPLDRILGPFDQAEAVRMALAPNRVALGPGREPLYRVELEALIVPEALRSGALICRPARTEDQPRLLDWRLDFLAEAMDQRPTPDLRSAEAVLVDRLIADSWQFVLEDRGRPVAMAAYNAALPDTVQIGGVWTPPEIRGRIYGRAAVAGALLAAKARGVAEAILFTNETNLAAQRAYAALGFERIGAYALILFAD